MGSFGSVNSEMKMSSTFALLSPEPVLMTRKWTGPSTFTVVLLVVKLV